MIMTQIRGLITPLITHEPPSRVRAGQGVERVSRLRGRGGFRV